MDLNLARIFVAVAHARSFTAAAKALGVPTSSVSRAVGRLESHLGTKLLARDTRKMSLTTAGRAYLEHAGRAVDELREGEQRVGELLGQLRGEIRLTLPANLDDGFAARHLVAFAQAHPQVQLAIVPTNRTVDLLAEGFDLALRVEQEPVSSSLLLRRLGRYHAWIVAAPAYVARHGAPRRPADLADRECVGMWPQRGRSRWPLHGPRGRETVEVRGPLAADDMHFAQQLVEAGGGIGVRVFAPGARARLEPGLVRVLPEYHVEGPTLFVATSSRKSLPRRVAALRALLVDAYAQVCGPASPG